MRCHTVTATLVFCATSATAGSEASNKAQAEVWDVVPEGSFTGGVEGPACDANGNLYAVGYGELMDGSAASGQLVALLTVLGLCEGVFSIGVVSGDGAHSAFADLPVGSIANGIRLNSRGSLYVADYSGHNVLEIDLATREVVVHAHDSRMNQPNDLAITSGDLLFASDPDWINDTGQVWRIGADGQVSLLETEMGTTNGIEVNPQEDLLYVAESVQRVIWQYDLSVDGEVSGKRELARFEDHGLDGMRCDVAGNLYVTRHGKGTVVVLSPDGQVLREVSLRGQEPTNIAFGGTDGQICYVTVADRGCIEAFRAERPGRSWVMMERRK